MNASHKKEKKNWGHSLMWMDLENVIQNEVSQKETNAHYVLTLISGLQKIGQMIFFAKQKQRHRCREQMYGYQAGKDEGWNELVDWGQPIYTIDTMCKIDN